MDHIDKVKSTRYAKTVAAFDVCIGLPVTYINMEGCRDDVVSLLENQWTVSVAQRWPFESDWVQ